MASKQKSAVWTHFTKCPGKKVKCSLCSMEMADCGNTSNMNKHLRLKHPAEAREHQNDEAQEKAKKRHLEQPTLQEVVQKKAKYPKESDRQKMLVEKLMFMVVKDMQPFSIVEDEGFRDFVKSLDPRFVIPSRTTLSRQHLKSMYDKHVEVLKSDLEGAEYIALTTDGWTSRQTTSYLTITCHYITNEWELKSAVLTTSHLKTDHTAQSIANEISTVCTTWNILHKIVAIVTDGAANMTAAVRLLDQRQMPCFAHMLNLVVKGAIAETQLATVRERVRDIVSYFHHSSKAFEFLSTLQEDPETNVEKHKLLMEVETRWNSTFQMLERYCEQHDTVTRALCYMNRPKMCLDGGDFQLAKTAVEILRPFEEVTKEFSAEKFISLSKVLILLQALRTKLSEKAKKSPFAQVLVDSLNRRFPDVEKHFPLGASTILDPRFKKLAFSSENALTPVITRLTTEMAAIKSDGEEPASTTTEAKESTSDLWSQFDTLVDSTSRRTATVTTEVEKRRYFEDQNIARSQDPLMYWKEKGALFPRLASLAQKYLCIPASSVPSERLFSAAGELVSAKRARLTPQNINMILFLNSNV